MLIWEVLLQPATVTAAATNGNGTSERGTGGEDNDNDDDDGDESLTHGDARLAFRLVTTLEHGAPVRDRMRCVCVVVVIELCL